MGPTYGLQVARTASRTQSTLIREFDRLARSQPEAVLGALAKRHTQLDLSPDEETALGALRTLASSHAEDYILFPGSVEFAPDVSQARMNWYIANWSSSNDAMREAVARRALGDSRIATYVGAIAAEGQELEQPMLAAQPEFGAASSATLTAA